MRDEQASPDGELTAFLSDHPATRHLDICLIDLCGNAVGKRLPRGHFDSFWRGGTPICAAMQLVDVNGNTADPMGHGFSDGDPDAIAVPVPGTLVPVPWAPEPRAQCLVELRRAGDGEPFWYEPRQILKSVAARFAELDLTPVAAVELEFYLIDRARDADGRPQPPLSPRTGARTSAGKVLSLAMLDEFGPVLSAIEDAARAQRLPVSTMISEYGAGQFEVNLEHRADPLEAADHGALLRRLVQEVARAQGLDATFLSKPYADQSGSGLHIHLSLQDRDGNNVFDPGLAGADERLAHAVGGLQATMAEAMAIFAPNINAFRRFAADQFVPVTTDWGDNNRSVAFRVPASPGAHSDPARRIEHRTAGAEANPYLVVATVLAGVHHGLTNRLDPGARHTGNAGTALDEALPFTMWDALARLEAAAILPGYLGADYPKVYATVKRAEFDAFMGEAFGREFEWYL